MTKKPANTISPHELDLLQTASEMLPSIQDTPEDTILLGQLIRAEQESWPQLFIERRCMPGEVLFYENAPGDSMYIIISGRLAVFKGEFRSPIMLGCRYPGEPIGEMALLEGLNRSANVVALAPTHLLEINQQNFQQLLGASPRFSQEIMRLLSARLRQASEAVKRESLDKIRDPLTGLYNRRYMKATLEQELLRAARAAYPVSLIMMDIDHFKELNDSFGHPAGDEVLSALADLICKQVRRADVACRYGGEEFLIILPETTLETSLSRAEDLRNAFAGLEVEYQGKIMQSTLSLGVAAYPRHAGKPQLLIQMADQALYTAKRGGRNRVIAAKDLP